jgi:hypothetical protein
LTGQFNFPEDMQIVEQLLPHQPLAKQLAAVSPRVIISDGLGNGDIVCFVVSAHVIGV